MTALKLLCQVRPDSDHAVVCRDTPTESDGLVIGVKDTTASDAVAQVHLTKAQARQLFNWLGVYLHT